MMGTVIVAALLIVAVGAALLFSRKRTGGACGCGCAGCSANRSCTHSRGQ